MPTGAEYINWSSSPSAGEVGLNLRRPRGDLDTARRDVGRPKKALDGAVFSTARRDVGRPKKAIDGAVFSTARRAVGRPSYHR